MKIVIVSDSHGRLYHFNKAMDKVGAIDLLIHLGDFEGYENEFEYLVDCPSYMVSGNNDFFSHLDREKLVQIGPYTIFMTHGHRYGVNYGVERLVEAAKEQGAHIVMYGHTHRPHIEKKDGIYVINPGSISQPRQEGRIPSYILMEIDRFDQVHFTLNFVE